LFGPATPGAAARPRTTASAQPPVEPASVVPVMPAPYTTTGSTAALAAGSTPTLNPDSNLRIPAAGNSGRAQAQVAPPAATLSVPQPNGDPSRSAPQPPAGPAGTLTGTQRAGSYESAQAELQARGVKVRRLEIDPQTGEWHFIGSLPNAQNPNISRTYETRAGDQLSALRAVIEQIDRER
jgi:hypothetical protein